jgi:large subunit ribosomal protein L23
MKDIHQVIKTIHLTEKAALLGEQANAHVFKVDRKANKLEIKDAIERAFNVKVASVNTANFKGKLKRQRRADAGRTAHWKKAIVTLADGETIDLV